MAVRTRRPRQVGTEAPQAVVERTSPNAESDGLADPAPEKTNTSSVLSLHDDGGATTDPTLTVNERIHSVAHNSPSTIDIEDPLLSSDGIDSPISLGITESLETNAVKPPNSQVTDNIKISGIAVTELATRQLAEISSRLEFKLPFFGSLSFRQSRQVDPEYAGQTVGGVAGISNKVASRQEQISLLSELSKLGIDPKLFDSMLSNELDRNLKRQFGLLFLSLTAVFTAIAYLVIIFAAAFKWNIPTVAITLLVAETPLQFIGLLYIIARNLFPQSDKTSERKNVRRASSSFTDKDDE